MINAIADAGGGHQLGEYSRAVAQNVFGKYRHKHMYDAATRLTAATRIKMDHMGTEAKVYAAPSMIVQPRPAVSF